jgi:site-specific DNA recombinase
MELQNTEDYAYFRLSYTTSYLRQLDDLKIECWSAEKAERLQGDDFLLQIQGAVASKERQEIIKRTQDGLYRAIKAGKYSGEIIAYGYRLNPETKILEIQDNEADFVRQMFDWCLQERLSCVQIAERLNAMGVPIQYEKDGRRIQRKGKREPEKTAGIWRAGRVRNMLCNPAYYGKWEWGKRSKKRKTTDRISGYCPPIISETVFVKVGEILHSNRLFLLENKHRDYLLRGLIKCSICGRTYCGRYSRVGPGG